ncbi:GTPase regulator Vps3 [Schizosaccharomyces japonicus yFS275]|uniref:GTPase regulator Vps3 n=1 Tax=Schizosaccharomyces japonicus (strain yFS275 / FY16936) TaxID=402676 RepID=B6K250_SCHJY|nr:GTPase regulator Vps3 [Schizosaccharomyces japonicus yFS275]EEB07231.1 GTPase regulator Vps3 [Schizosaccharomyces japonicus yFS275]
MKQFALQSLSIPSEIKSKATCIVTIGDFIIVGDNQGTLYQFDVSVQSNTDYAFLQKKTLKPAACVHSLTNVPYAKLLLVHYGTWLTYVNPYTLARKNVFLMDQVKQLAFDKPLSSPATMFLAITETQLKELYIQKDGILRKHKEFPSGDVIQASYRKGIVCLAGKEMYTLIDLQAETSLPLFPTPMCNPESKLEDFCEPLIAKYHDEFLLIAGSADAAIGMFIDKTGSVTRNTVLFQEYPKTLYVNDGIVFAFGKSKLHIINVHDQEQEQVLDCNISNYPYFCPVKLPVFDPIDVDKLTFVYALVDFPPAYEDAVLAKRAACSYSFFVLLGSSDWLAVHVQSPFLFLQDSILKGEVDSTLKQLRKRAQNPSKYGLSNETIFQQTLYLEQLIALHYWKENLFEDMLKYLKSSKMDPLLLLSLFPRYRVATDTVIVYKGILEQIRSVPPFDECIIEHLKHNELYKEADDATKSQILNLSKENALIMLHRYLSWFRGQKGYGSLSGKNDQEKFKIVEKTLLHLYFDVQFSSDRTDDLKELLRTATDLTDEARRVLESHHEYGLLVYMYKVTHNTEGVLVTLKKIISGECDSTTVPDAVLQLYDELLHTKVSPLFWRYATWFAQRDPSLASDVLVARTKEGNLDADDVVRNFVNEDGPVLILFLKYINNPVYSNLCIQLCLQYVIRCIENDNTISTFFRKLVGSYRCLGLKKPSFEQYIEEKVSQSEALDSIVKIAYLQLVHLLSETKSMEDSKAMQLIECMTKVKSLLPHVSAHLYHLVGDHQQALHEMLQLFDFKTANKYCLDNYQREEKCWEWMLQGLLECNSTPLPERVLLDETEEDVSQLELQEVAEYISHFLARNFIHYDFSMILKHFSGDSPLCLFTEYFKALQRHQAMRAYKSEIRLNLQKGLWRQTRDLLTALTERKEDKDVKIHD